MDNYFLYLQEESKANDWGLHIPTCGYQHIYPGDCYPLPGHPDTHTFNWQKGRVLKDYYIIYILTGRGDLETKLNRWEINPGDVIMLAPGEWHRYKPTEGTGWEEYWIGFSGNFLSGKILKELIPTGASYVKPVGFQEELIFLFNKSLELAKKNSPGFKKILVGIVMQLVAYIVTYENKESMKREEQLSNQIISFIRKQLITEIDFKTLASEHHLSYNRFRTIFKNETGISLQQYLIRERLENAKRLIINTDLSIKEVSVKTGFRSLFYFSKVFKNKMGYSPRQIRTNKTSG